MSIWRGVPAGAKRLNVLHVFRAAQWMGLRPWHPDKSGNFFGTTLLGGASAPGTIFERSAAGTYRLRHAFNGADGVFPETGLIGDSAGKVYGTTKGVVFSLTPSETYTVLYSFCSRISTGICLDGRYPGGNLVALGNGNLCGTTVRGGTMDAGMVYQLSGSGFVLPTATAERYPGRTCTAATLSPPASR
jgi:uncharacterized repeat protein (TIGR03803 family)